MSPGSRVVVKLISGLVLLLASARAATAQSTLTTVAAVVRPGDGADPTFVPILRDLLRFALPGYGASMVQADLSGDIPAGLDTLKAGGAGYAILLTYQDQGGEIGLSLTLYDLSRGAQVSTAVASGTIDLSLDAVVDGAVGRLLSGVVLAPDAMPRDTGIAAGTSDTTAQPTQQPVTPTAARPAGGSARPPVRPFGMGAGSALLVLTGEAAEVGTLGVLAHAAVHGRLRAGPGSLALGLTSVFAWVRVTGIVAGSDVDLVALGPDVAYTPFETGVMIPTLRLSGGPAILSLSTSYTGRLTKVVPYVLGGMAVSVPFGARIGLEVEACYIVFLEPTLPIMGFAPGLSVWVRP